ncbi:hypothetical protein HDU87_004187 [Geranomyces variabilis]|uniref:Zn(2)-C6 fungal-type domain-containing protein n=1 Tax=Geranomyces variabilis TaxID=109894 RepID=A0AAD5TJ10_9FUNG|nr:hypothetical protein HDU87_004187 [Geranomyces variabilis]
MSGSDNSSAPAPDWALFPGYNLDLTALLGVDNNQLDSFQDLLEYPQQQQSGLGSEGSLSFLDGAPQQQQPPLQDYSATDSNTGSSNANGALTANGTVSEPFNYDGFAQEPSSSFAISSEAGSSTNSLPAKDNSTPPSQPINGASTANGTKRRKQQPASASRPIAKPNTRRKACEPCRAKKLRCDGLRPVCTTCNRSSQTAALCLYYVDNPNAVVEAKSKSDGPNAESRPKRRGADDVKALEDRVNALEAMLASAIAEKSPGSPTHSTPSPLESHRDGPSKTWPTDGFFEMLNSTPQLPASRSSGSQSSTDPTPPAMAPNTSSPELPFPHHKRPDGALCEGPTLPTVAALTGKTWFNDFVITFNETLSVKALDTHLNKARIAESAVTDLQGVLIRRDLLNEFFSKTRNNAPFDFLHRDSFLRDVENESPMLLFALYAQISNYSPDENVRHAASYFYQRARKLVPMHLENPTLSGLQGFAFLAAASMGQGLMSAGWMYLGMACRMALFLRLDVDPDELGSFTWAEAESRRRIWWCIASLDRVKSAVQGRASFLPHVQTSRVKYPGPDAIWEVADINGNLPAHMVGVPYEPFTAHIARFTALYARAIEYNRTSLRQGIDLESFCTTTTLLEAEVQEWYHSLPAVVHAVPECDNYTFDLQSVNKTPYQAVTCYMMYVCTLSLIRRPRIVSALVTTVRSPAAIRAIESATQAAKDVSAMAERMLGAQPEGGPSSVHADYVSFFCALGTLEAAFIQIIASSLARVARDIKQFEEHQRCFSALIKFLRAMGKRSPPSRLMANVVGVINQELMTRAGRARAAGGNGHDLAASLRAHGGVSPCPFGAEVAKIHTEDGGPCPKAVGRCGGAVKLAFESFAEQKDIDLDDESIELNVEMDPPEHETWVREMVMNVCREPMSGLIQKTAVKAGGGGGGGGGGPPPRYQQHPTPPAPPLPGKFPSPAPEDHTPPQRPFVPPGGWTPSS